MSWLDKAAMRTEAENDFYNAEFNNQIVHKAAGTMTGRLCEEALRGDVDESTIYNSIQDFFAEFPYAKVFVYTDNMGEARTLFQNKDGSWMFEPVVLSPLEELEARKAAEKAAKKAKRKKQPVPVTEDPQPEAVEGEALLEHFKTMQSRFKQGGYMMYQRKKIF